MDSENINIGTFTSSFQKSGFYPVFVLIFAMLCLSLNHVIGRGVHMEVPPIGLGFWRWLLGAAVILPFIWPNRKSSFPVILKQLRYFLTAGTLLAVSSTSVLVALHVTTATNAAMINSTQPIITVILVWIFLKEQLSWVQGCGILFAFLGVLVMLSKGNWLLLTQMQFNAGDVIVVAAMFGLATYSIKVRKLPNELTTIESLFAIILTGCLVLLPFYVIETLCYRSVPVSFVSVWSILGMAFFVVVLGMLAWNKGIQLLGPAVSSVFLNLIPVFGALLSMFFLNEKFYLYHLICFLLIFTGMLMTLGKNLKNMSNN